jgi:hypothetical protein
MAVRNSTIAKAILKIIEKKLEEKVDDCNPLNNWGDPTVKKMLEKGLPAEHLIEPHLKKERDKYSTYLRQVRDILQLFEK